MKAAEIDVNEKIGNVREILTDTQKKRGILIHAFQQIQKAHNYLPEEQLILLSRKLDIPLSEVYSTASFTNISILSPGAKMLSASAQEQPAMSGAPIKCSKNLKRPSA